MWSVIHPSPGPTSPHRIPALNRPRPRASPDKPSTGTRQAPQTQSADPRPRPATKPADTDGDDPQGDPQEDPGIDPRAPGTPTSTETDVPNRRPDSSSRARDRGDKDQEASTVGVAGTTDTPQRTDQAPPETRPAPTTASNDDPDTTGDQSQFVVRLMTVPASTGIRHPDEGCRWPASWPTDMVSPGKLPPRPPRSPSPRSAPPR